MTSIICIIIIFSSIAKSKPNISVIINTIYNQNVTNTCQYFRFFIWWQIMYQPIWNTI